MNFSSLDNKKATFLSKFDEYFDYVTDMLDWCRVYSLETDIFVVG